MGSVNAPITLLTYFLKMYGPSKPVHSLFWATSQRRTPRNLQNLNMDGQLILFYVPFPLCHYIMGFIFFRLYGIVDQKLRGTLFWNIVYL